MQEKMFPEMDLATAMLLTGQPVGNGRTMGTVEPELTEDERLVATRRKELAVAAETNRRIEAAETKRARKAQKRLLDHAQTTL